MKTINLNKPPAIKSGFVFLITLAWAGLLSILVIALIAARAPQLNPASQAEVNQVQGILIFTDSKPLQQFEYLGTVKAYRITGGNQYQPLRDHLVKKIKKDYPAANGAILHLTSGGADYADAIKIQ